MTGEVTLNGRVLPIGGVKQKLLAAQRAGLTEVFLPQRNEPDLDDVPAEVLDASPSTWSATSGRSWRRRSSRPAGGQSPRSGLDDPPTMPMSLPDRAARPRLGTAARAGVRAGPRGVVHDGHRRVRGLRSRRVLGCSEDGGRRAAARPADHPGRGRDGGAVELPVVAAPARPAVLLGHHQPGRPAAAPTPRAWCGGCSTRTGCRTSCTASGVRLMRRHEIIHRSQQGFGPRPRGAGTEQPRRGCPAASARSSASGLVPGREGDHRPLVEQVQLAAEPVGSSYPASAQRGEQLPHPGLLVADHRQPPVLGAAQLGVGVDERAAAPLLGQPALSASRTASTPGGPRRSRVRGEPVSTRPCQVSRPAPQVQRDERVLGAEPVVERLLRGAARPRRSAPRRPRGCRAA